MAARMAEIYVVADDAVVKRDAIEAGRLADAAEEGNPLVEFAQFDVSGEVGVVDTLGLEPFRHLNARPVLTEATLRGEPGDLFGR